SFPFPEVRNVPVLTSVDCVSTRTGMLGFFAFPFCGTSAAAPHVAGMVALLIERAPTLSSDQLRGVLMSTAVDLGPAGYDFVSGFGRADAFNALNFVSSGPHVQVTLFLNRATVAAGDPLQINFTESNTGTGTTQDIYLGVAVPAGLPSSLGCPAGDALVLFADGGARAVTVCYTTAPLQSFAPFIANHPVGAALPPTSIASFALPWPASAAGGTYTFVGVATPPG